MLDPRGQKKGGFGAFADRARERQDTRPASLDAAAAPTAEPASAAPAGSRGAGRDGDGQAGTRRRRSLPA